MKLTIAYDTTDTVWYAYEGPTQDGSRFIGQGQSAEDACSDYWYQAAGKSAHLTHDAENGWWVLSQDFLSRHFPSEEAAITYADEHNWQII